MIIDKGSVTVSSIARIAAQGESRFLEIGCGDGRLTHGLHSKFQKLVAIDPDEASIRTAQEKNPRIDFRKGSGESLDFAEDSFDIILFSLSLHHHHNGVKALKEAGRVLTSAGKIVVVEPAVESPVSQLCNIFEDESAALLQTKEIMRQSDFTILATEKIFTKWEFDEREDLLDWLFSYYKRQPDSIVIEQIDAFLGTQYQEEPIILSDILELTQLSLPHAGQKLK